MTLPETHDCRSCGREAALGAEGCPCGASFDPLLRASEAALESLEHKEYVVLEKDIIDDPTESGYRRSRLGKPKGQDRDYRLSAGFFEEKEEEEEKEEAEEAKETEGDDRRRLPIIDVSLPSSVNFPSFESAGVPASVDGVGVSQFDLSIPSLGSVSLRSLRDVKTPSFDDVGLPSFGNVGTPSLGGGDDEGNGAGTSQEGTDSRELHLREYEDRYTLHWDAHPATSPMHAVKDAPDYGAACVAAAGVVAAAVGSRLVKRRRE